MNMTKNTLDDCPDDGNEDNNKDKIFTCSFILSILNEGSFWKYALASVESPWSIICKEA